MSDQIEIISISPSGKPGIYGVRALHRRPNVVSDALCDVLYDSREGKIVFCAEQPGVQENSGLHSLLLKAIGSAGTGTEPRPFAFLKVDIVSHSRISADFPQRETDSTWDAVADLVGDSINQSKGELWSWQGDGGLAAFVGDLKEETAVQCAIDLIEDRLVAFNQDKDGGNRLPEEIQIRAGVHSGWARERQDRGLIHSRDINFVAHVEAQRTAPNGLTISRETYVELPGSMQERFHKVAESFEGHEIYSTTPLDELQQYLTTRQMSNDSLQRETIELRRKIEELESRLDSGVDAKVLRTFLAEVSENAASIADEDMAIVALNIDAWNQHKGDIGFLDPRTQGELQSVYLQIQRINTLARDHLETRVARARTSIKRDIERAKDDVEQSLRNLRDTLASELP